MSNAEIKLQCLRAAEYLAPYAIVDTKVGISSNGKDPDAILELAQKLFNWVIK